MKFGIHLSTLTNEWDQDVFGYIRKMKEYGYDGVEFPLMDPDDFRVDEAKKLLRDYSMECTCGTGMNLQRDISSEDKDINKNGINHLKRCLDICNELETDCLGGVLYAPWGTCMSRELGKDNIKRSIENLSRIGDYAKEKGVVLALEMINRYETYVINNVDDGLSFIDKIDNDNVKLHFDTFHANIEEKSVKNALIRGNKKIYHIHFCENDRGTPGTGLIDWKQVKEGLEAIKYDRWITLENFVVPNCQVGNDVFIWRNIEENGIVAAKEGIRFMKELFELG